MAPIMCGVAFGVLVFLCSIAIIFSWQTRRIMIAAFGENPARAQLGARGWYVRPADPPRELAPPAAPSSSRPGARVAAPEPAPGLTPLTTKPARASFKPPSLAPLPNYAGELELHHGAPETTRKPGAAPISRERPAVTPRPDLATLARDLDAADRAQADQAPEPRTPTTRPPPSSQRAPAASVTHAALAPPASAPAWAPQPGIVAAGLGERPQGRHEARSERPPPHKPPQAARKPTLLGIPPPATVRPPPALRPVSTRPLPVVVPPAPRAPEPPPRSPGDALAPIALGASSPEDDFDFDDEATRVGPRPAPGALGSAVGAQDAAPRRRIYATLASMPSIVPGNGRPTPPVSVVEATAVDDDEQRATLKPGDATAPAATP